MDNGLRDLYDTFLDSGELKSVLPEATGIWETDKVLFANIYSGLDGSLNIEDDEVRPGYWDEASREFLLED